MFIIIIFQTNHGNVSHCTHLALDEMMHSFRISFIGIIRQVFRPDGTEKQGRIHGYLSSVRVGRGSDGEGPLGIWAGAVSSKR